MTEAIVSPYTLSSIDTMLRQKRAAGQIVTPQEIRAAYEGALEAEARRSLENRRLEQQNIQFQQEMDLRKKMYEDQRSGQMWTGAFGLGSMGLKAIESPTLKKWWGKMFPDKTEGTAPAVAGPAPDAGTPSNIAVAPGLPGGEAVTAGFNQPAVGWYGAPSQTMGWQPASLGFYDSGAGSTGEAVGSGWNYNFGSGSSGTTDFFPEYSNLFSW